MSTEPIAIEPAAASTAPVPRTLEIARFTTRRSDEAAFLASHAAAMRAIRAAYPSLAGVTTVRFASDGDRTTWADVAIWTSAEEARRAATTCMTIPEFAECVRFMESDEGVEHGEIVARY